MKIYTIICCINDTEYTRDTLVSLGMSNNIDDFDVNLVYAETESMPMNEFDEVVSNLPYEANIYKREKALEHRYNFVFALNKFKDNKADYYVWIENDNLFNPGWFAHVLEAERVATKDGYDVGLISPHNISHGKYHACTRGIYTTKRLMPGPCFVMSADTANKIETEALLNAKRPFMADHNLCRQLSRRGKTHICLTKSTAQHIGINRSTFSLSNWNKRGRGGLGFEPDKKILALWEKYNVD